MASLLPSIAKPFLFLLLPSLLPAPPLMAASAHLPFRSFFFLFFFLFLRVSFQFPAFFGPPAAFIFNATDFPREEAYDYIVVGGGTAGCPLAATLSQKHTVLLLERGASSLSFPNTMTSDSFLTTLMQTDRDDSPAQAFISEDGVPNARGRILGGSSAINAGFYSRADDEFFRGGGAVDWDMALVNASYEWVERVVAFKPNVGTWQLAFLDALLEADAIHR